MRVSNKKLEKLMARECMTMRELADKGGLHIATLARIKNGDAEVIPKTVGKIARALNANVNEIMEEE